LDHESVGTNIYGTTHVGKLGKAFEAKGRGIWSILLHGAARIGVWRQK